MSGWPPPNLPNRRLRAWGVATPNLPLVVLGCGGGGGGVRLEDRSPLIILDPKFLDVLIRHSLTFSLSISPPPPPPLPFPVQLHVYQHPPYE